MIAYFNFWPIDIPPSCHVDRNSAFQYCFGGIRTLFLDGYTHIEVTTQDDSFEATDGRLELSPNCDFITGWAAFRSQWGTLRVMAIRGKEHKLILDRTFR